LATDLLDRARELLGVFREHHATMSRPRRPFVALLLGLLLVGMQYGSQLHALEHVKEALENAQHQSFTLPNDEVCAICALFAGGANALADEVDLGTPVVGSEEHVSYAPLLTARATLRFYDSRAPPVSL
jgi:hypothetical protein